VLLSFVHLGKRHFCMGNLTSSCRLIRLGYDNHVTASSTSIVPVAFNEAAANERWSDDKRITDASSSQIADPHHRDSGMVRGTAVSHGLRLAGDLKLVSAPLVSSPMEALAKMHARLRFTGNACMRQPWIPSA
jgi:hypothetical protein